MAWERHRIVLRGRARDEGRDDRGRPLSISWRGRGLPKAHSVHTTPPAPAQQLRPRWVSAPVGDNRVAGRGEGGQTPPLPQSGEGREYRRGRASRASTGRRRERRRDGKTRMNRVKSHGDNLPRAPSRPPQQSAPLPPFPTPVVVPHYRSSPSMPKPRALAIMWYTAVLSRMPRTRSEPGPDAKTPTSCSV